jgi:D-alanyl-lipoteichoic acid acyltransferase DltB (MBOAT superfamily)
MLFDSPIYFVFLVPVVLLYWRLSHRGQNVFLLLASYVFYGWWDWRFLALMIGGTTADFFIAHQVVPGRPDASRKKWLVFSLILNFTILGVFKYLNFFAGSFIAALNHLGVHNIPLPLIQIILPPGISFYTFEEVAYIVDVYKGRVQPSKSFLDYGLFISLFPHLIAGPIQRPGNLLPQIQKQRSFEASQFFDGLMLIFSGLIRKCVIADNCAFLANAAFGGQLGKPSFLISVIGIYAFAWQIYGDFSGYTDIARGSAKLLGFDFVVNFRQPYLSQSVREFWRRWHISLSTWLRDYLYIPLGGSRRGNWRTYRNLMITMVLAGLWHGANWTFIVFGAMQGLAMSAERMFAAPGKEEADALPQGRPDRFVSVWLQRILTFNIWCLSLVFFRVSSLGSALQFLGGLSHFAWRAEYSGAFVMLCLFALPLFGVDLLLESRNQEYPFAEAPYVFRTAMAAAALVALALFSGNKFSTFIYFQF